QPAASGPQSASSLRVMLTPVDTTGLGSSAKAEYGFDLSAYFTAFDLKLSNGSNQPVEFDSGEIYLVYADGKKERALSVDESIDYYRYGDLGHDGAIVLLSKPLGMMREDIEQIRKLHIQSATVNSGESHRGVVLFKKIDSDGCQNIHVQLQGITFAE